MPAIIRRITGWKRKNGRDRTPPGKEGEWVGAARPSVRAAVVYARNVVKGFPMNEVNRVLISNAPPAGLL